MHTLIIGDSFSADNHGWPSLLGLDVENRSQKGVGEYKIYKQFSPTDKFDLVIVCHTSPWRIHTPRHPVHEKNPVRSNCDFLLSDVDYHGKNNHDMQLVKKYWEKYYDFDYQEDIYKLIFSELYKLPNSIHITFHQIPVDIIKNNFSHIWKQHPGDINHLNSIGNKIVADNIKKLIEKM